MDLSALSGVDLSAGFNTSAVSSSVGDSDSTTVSGSSSPFQALFNSALKMVNETNDYSNAAEEEEIKYSLGESDSIHDLQIAQQKANVSLQYTVAVRDTFMTGYKEIMNLQF